MGALALVLTFVFTYSMVDAIPNTVTVNKVGHAQNFIGNTDIAMPMLAAQDGTSVYCMDIDKKFLEGQSASLIGDGDAGLLYILQNGYPHRSYKNNKEMDAYITQMAVWWYVAEDKLSNDFKNATGEAVIRAKLLTDSIKSKILENMLEESAKQSLVPRVRIIDAVNYMKDETSGICIPAVKVEKNGENENYELDGCALFGRDSTFSMYIDSQTAEGVAILNDKIEEGVISADLPNGQKASFYINKGKSRYKITEENGGLHYNLKVAISCDLEGVQGDEYFSTDTGVLETFQTAVGESLCRKAENTLIVLQGKHGADVVRYGKRLRLKENDLYQNMKNDWDRVFPEIKLTITADVTIRRIGEETFHSRKQ